MNKKAVQERKLYWGLAGTIDISEATTQRKFGFWFTGPQSYIAFIFVHLFVHIASEKLSRNSDYTNIEKPAENLEKFCCHLLGLLLYWKSTYKKMKGGSHATISYISFVICLLVRESVGNLRPGYQIHGNN